MYRIAIAGYKEKAKNYVEVLKRYVKDVVVSLDLEEIKDCHALVLPGGGDINPEYWNEKIDGADMPDEFLDKAQYKILDYFVKKDRPVLGICRGMQFINVYFGGSMIQDIDTGHIHSGIKGEEGLKADRVHEVYSVKDSFFEKEYGKKFFVNSYHHQALNLTGQGIEVLLKSDDGVIEAIEHASKNILGVQFHPERMCFLNSRKDTVDGSLIFEYFISML